MRTRTADFGIVALAALAVLAGLLAACERSASPARLLIGESGALGEGSARAWIALDGEDRPTALGVTLTEAALSASTAPAPAPLVLALPAEGRAAPFDHIELAWWPAGAGAEDLLAEPHLDVRFSLFSARERAGLTDAAIAVRVPSLDRVPARYIPVPRLVPGLGAYWIDPAAPAYSSPHFSEALLFGFYGGELVVLEPKLSLRLLESRQSLTRELELPRHLVRPGYYPTRYRVDYDPGSREHTVALEGLTRRP